MNAHFLANRIVASWRRTRKVFSAGHNSLGIASWIDLVTLIAAGPQGLPLQQFRKHRNSGVIRRRLDRWEKAGLVILWHHIGDNAANGRKRLRVRATSKAHHLLNL